MAKNKTRNKDAKLHKKLKLEIKEKAIKKEHLQQELQATEQNMRKVIDKWDKIMTKCKVKELRQDIRETNQLIKEWLRKKTNVIELLLEQFDENEQQMYSATSIHIEATEKLIDIYLRCAEKDGRNELKGKLNNLLKIRHFLAQSSAKQVKFMEHLTTAKFLNDEKFENEMLIEDRKKMDQISDEECAHYVQMEGLEWKLEQQIEQRLIEIQNRIKMHNYENVQKRKLYETIKAKNDVIIVMRHQQEIKLEELKAKLVALKQRMEKRSEISEQLEQLLSERKELFALCLSVKQKAEKREISDKERLRLLITHSERAVTYLNEICLKGHNVKRILQLCRPLEIFQTGCLLQFQPVDILGSSSELEMVWNKISFVKESSANLARSIAGHKLNETILKDFLKVTLVKNYGKNQTRFEK